MNYSPVSFYDSKYVKHPFDIDLDCVEDDLFAAAWVAGDHYCESSFAGCDSSRKTQKRSVDREISNVTQELISKITKPLEKRLDAREKKAPEIEKPAQVKTEVSQVVYRSQGTEIEETPKAPILAAPVVKVEDAETPKYLDPYSAELDRRAEVRRKILGKVENEIKSHRNSQAEANSKKNKALNEANRKRVESDFQLACKMHKENKPKIEAQKLSSIVREHLASTVSDEIRKHLIVLVETINAG